MNTIKATKLSGLKLEEFEQLLGNDSLDITLDKNVIFTAVKNKPNKAVSMEMTYSKFKRFDKKLINMQLESGKISCIKIVANINAKEVCYIKK